MASFCYIHVGSTSPPPHMLDSIYQTQAWNPETPIYVVLNRVDMPAFGESLAATRIDGSNVTVVPVDTLAPTNHHRAFQSYRTFKTDFFRFTSERFFVLEEFIETYQLRDVIHLENDVMIYFSLDRLLPAFRRHGPMAVTQAWLEFVVPGLMYIADAAPMRAVNLLLTEWAPKGYIDMSNLARFQYTNGTVMRRLPVIMPDYDRALAADYSRGFDDFLSIFDAAAIGQYLGGVDPRSLINAEEGRGRSTAGYVNPNCVFDCRKLEFDWHSDEANGLRRPRCRVRAPQAPWVDLNNLHVHVKRLHPFSSRLWIDPANLVTGERLQALADVSFVPRDIARFHRNVERYAPKALMFNDYTQVGPDLIGKLDPYRVFFVYTHALDGFLQHIWPRLPGRGYTLISHNSDHEIDERFRPWLDAAGDKLDRWFAQNVTIAHPKLVPLPIGIANSMWPHGDLDTLHDRITAWEKMRKSHLVYLQFNPATHPARQQAWEKLHTRFPQLSAQPPAAKPFGEYLDALAAHQFCVCPRGNGIDTHRVWECLYLGVIPIMERSWHTEYWQQECGLPLLVVDDWLEVTEARLMDARPRIAEQFARCRDCLSLDYYRRLLRSRWT